MNEQGLDLCIGLDDFSSDPSILDKIDELKQQIGYFYFVENKSILEHNDIVRKNFQDLKIINGSEFANILNNLNKDNLSIRQIFNKNNCKKNIVKVCFQGTDFDLCFKNRKLAIAS